MKQEKVISITLKNPLEGRGWNLSLKGLRKPARYGLCSALLTIVVIIAAYSIYNYTFNQWAENYSGNSSGYPQIVWMVVFWITAFLLSLYACVGLPVTWGRAKGFGEVCKIILLEILVFAVALIVSGFFLFGTGSNSSPQQQHCGDLAVTANPDCGY